MPKYIAVIAALLSVGASGVSAGLCDAYKVAAEDIMRLDDVTKFGAVYFWLGDLREQDRPMAILVLAGHLHGLSREPSLHAFPQVIVKDYSVVRVNYLDYGWSLEFIQYLLRADPYREYDLKYGGEEQQNFVWWPGGVWSQHGDSYPKGNFYIKWKRVPVFSASWFVWQTLIQEDRVPGYLDALRLKDRTAMDELSGFSADVNKKAIRSDYIEMPELSNIARKKLRNVVIQHVSGGVRYGTEDSRKTIKEFNPLVPRNEFSKHDAEEWIFDLPNGFKGFFLSDAKGKSQDFAPAEIVGFDKSAPHNDGLIHVGLSCLRCHYRKAFHGSAGIIDFDYHFRNPDGLTTNSPDYERFQEFKRQYLRAFGDEFIISKLRTNAAVINATGLTADDWAYRLTSWWEAYENGATLDESAAFIGCSLADLVVVDPKTGKVVVEKKTGRPLTGPLLKQTLVDYAAKTGLLDNTLRLFARGKVIPRDNYHEIYHVLRETWKGMAHARPFDPKEHFVPLGTPGYDVSKWAVPGSKLPSGIQLPKLPANIRLPGSSQLQLPGLQQLQYQQLCLSGSNPALLSGLSEPERRDQRGSVLHAADRDQSIVGAISTRRSSSGDYWYNTVHRCSVGREVSIGVGENSRGYVRDTKESAVRASSRWSVSQGLYILSQRGECESEVPTVRRFGGLLTTRCGRGRQDSLSYLHAGYKT